MNMESYLNKRLQHLTEVERKQALVMLCIIGLETVCGEKESTSFVDIIDLNKRCGKN